MGTQFWWFYDVIVAAIILVCMFIWGKKGVIKSVCALVSCFLAAVIAFGISAGTAKTLYSSTVRVSNIKKIDNNIDDDTFLSDYSSYLESLGYNIKVDQTKLDEILNGEGSYTEAICKYVNNINGRKVEKDDEVLRQKVRKGYAVVISNIVSNSLNNKYVSETAEEIIIEKGNIDKLIPLIANHDVQKDAAEYIVDNYTADAYHSIFSLAALLVFFVILVIFIGFIMRSFIANAEDMDLSMGNHIAGGILGILTGGVFSFAAAAVVRLWTLMSSNDMLFFNSDVVDKTYVFKFLYGLISSL